MTQRQVAVVILRSVKLRDSERKSRAGKEATLFMAYVVVQITGF